MRFLSTMSVLLACAAVTPLYGQQRLDVPMLRDVLGRTVSVQDGEVKVTVPQNDLQVRVGEFDIIPPMGLGSWVAFTPHPQGALLMGDLVVLASEIGPLQSVLLEHDITVSGLHNHFAGEQPSVKFMHIHATGPQDRLARGVRAALDRIAELRGHDPAVASAATVQSTLDTARLSAILGHRGELNRGVYRVTIGRPDVDLRDHGVRVSTFMGFNTWAAFQGSMQRAAVAGDFAMLEHEVPRVIGALVQHGIAVVAVHNHMVNERPRIVFLHYWGVGAAEDLARGLRAGLDQLGK